LIPQGFLFEKEREQQQQQQPGRNNNGPQRKLTVDAKRQVRPVSRARLKLHTLHIAGEPSRSQF
jgi:hypothetical protein